MTPNEQLTFECKGSEDLNDHELTYKEDWEGDPGVINGTNTIRYFQCENCGAQFPASGDDAPDYSDLDYDGDYDASL